MSTSIDNNQAAQGGWKALANNGVLLTTVLNPAEINSTRAKAETLKAKINEDKANCNLPTTSRNSIVNELGEFLSSESSAGGAKFTDEEVKFAMNILQQAGLPLEMLGQVLNHNPKSDHQSTEELSETINSEITESSQNLVEHYDQVTKELTLGLAQLQEANSKQDPEVREAITQVKIELNNTNEASKFHGEEAQFGTALSNTLDANPNVFNGKPENLAKFNELLKLHIEQQSGVDSLLSATNNDDPIVKSKLAETKTGNIASRYQLLHLAKGGDLKDLDTIASLATELVARPDNLKSHYGSVRIDLENGMDELSSAQANNDPEVKKEMTELRTEMLNTNHAQEFWGDEKKFGTQLMKELLNNPQTLNSNIFKDLVSVHSGLSGGFDELMSQGQDQNDPSVKQALADLTIENKSNSSQLLYIARGGQPNNLDYPAGFSQM